MMRPRIIPCLLLRGRGLVTTRRFKDARYVGDPVNTVRIFNEKEVDELMVLDITATPESREPSYGFIEELASECFMPVSYGGGVRSLEQVERLFKLGVEKVVINTAAIEHPKLVSQAAEQFGSQSIVVAIDVKKSWLGKYRVLSHGGSRSTPLDPVSYAREVEFLGAGEIVLTSVDRDGTMAGFDLDVTRDVSAAVSVPVVACGGAGSYDDFAGAVSAGASAAAAGSLFAYQGNNRSVLINYPTQEELRRALQPV